MTEKEIYQKIVDTYNSEKGKGFITHLIRSFFPVDRAQTMWDKPKNPPVCCITGQKLISKEEMFELFQDSQEEMITWFKDQVRFDIDSYEGKEAEAPEHPLIKRAGGRVLGICSSLSDKFLHPDAYKQLYNFIVNEMFSGNKHIEWVLNNERGKAITKKAKEEKFISTKKEEIAVQKVVEHKKLTFGDLEVLQKIKENFEKDDK